MRKSRALGHDSYFCIEILIFFMDTMGISDIRYVMLIDFQCTEDSRSTLQHTLRTKIGRGCTGSFLRDKAIRIRVIMQRR